MAYLQEIKIVETAPIVGSTREPNVIFIVPITEKVCDMYTSDNVGIVRATSVQTPIFTSKEEANAGIPIGNRWEGKMVMIVTTYTGMVPVLDEDGNPVLDENDEPVMEETSRDVYNLHWWKNGVEDENLVYQAPSLEAVLSNGNRLPANTSIIFTSSQDPQVPPEYWGEDSVNEVHLSAGFDGTNFHANSGTKAKEENFFYGTILIGSQAGKNLESAWSTLALGAATLQYSKKVAGVMAIGPSAMADFQGESEEMDYHSFGGVWGKVHANMAIGYWAGKGLKEGHSNLYIGNVFGSRPATEKGKFMVHMHKEPGGGTTTAVGNAKYPLIFGDFIERWLNIAGKFRISKHHNPIAPEENTIEHVAALQESTDTRHHEVVPVKTTTMVLNAIKSMSEAEKLELKTALGLSE